MVTAQDIEELATNMDEVFVRFKVVDKYTKQTQKEFDSVMDHFINEIIHVLEKRHTGVAIHEKINHLLEGEDSYPPKIDRAWKRQNKIWNILDIMFTHEKYIPALEHRVHQLQSEMNGGAAEAFLAFYHQFMTVMNTFRRHLPEFQENAREKEATLRLIQNNHTISFDDLSRLFSLQHKYEHMIIRLDEDLKPALAGMEPKMKNFMRGMGQFISFSKQQTARVLHSDPYQLSVAAAFIVFLFMVKILSFHGLLFGALAILLKVAHSIHAFEVFEKKGVNKKVVNGLKSVTKNMKKASSSPIREIMKPLFAAMEFEEHHPSLAPQ